MDTGSAQHHKNPTRTALELLQAFREIDQEMPMGAALAFLHIATAEGLSVDELRARTGDALSSASRYHNYLGAKDRHQRPGKGLIYSGPNYADTRRKALMLSPQGKDLVGKLSAILSK